MVERVWFGCRWLVAALAAVTLTACGGGGDGASCPADGLAVPDVSGTWRIEALGISSSTCPAALNDVLEDAVAELDACTYVIAQDGARLETVDCDGGRGDACVDAAGTVTATDTVRESQSGCTVRIDETFIVNLATLPAPGTSSGRIRISGNCTVQTDCTAVIDVEVTRPTSVRAAGGGADGAFANLAVLLAGAARR